MVGNQHQLDHSKGKRGKEEGPGEGGGSQGELGEGPGVVDLQKCGGYPEHVMFLLYSAHILRIYGRYLMLEGCPKSSF